MLLNVQRSHTGLIKDEDIIIGNFVFEWATETHWNWAVERSRDRNKKGKEGLGQGMKRSKKGKAGEGRGGRGVRRVRRERQN